jgi:hypothetical protein
MGELGQFENTAQPSIEVFSLLGTQTAQVGVMDLVKIS